MNSFELSAQIQAFEKLDSISNPCWTQSHLSASPAEQRRGDAPPSLATTLGLPAPSHLPEEKGHKAGTCSDLVGLCIA